ncbi:MAG: hypothetical protein H7833_10190 [Magnetococcus sp. DMHC-1]|nr:hypothetical protein [Magnetococcales bacterium]
MLPLEAFCCQNPDCPDAGIRGKRNLRRHGYSGHKQQIRGLFCKTCRKYFSERKGTVLEHSRLETGKAVSLLKHLRDGCGVRSTGRLVGVSPDTVVRYSRLAGSHGFRLHDELVAISPATKEVQFDEKWGFVFQKEAHCAPGIEDQGDNWDHTALDAEHRLMLAVVPGKRTAEKCHKVVSEVKKRTEGRTDLLLTSDEHAPCKSAIKAAYTVEDQHPEHRQRKKNQTKNARESVLCNSPKDP